MLTSYMVKCPNSGCDWTGSLLPEGPREAWRGAAPSTSEVAFQCPKCRRIWHARLIGDNVESTESVNPDLTPAPWA